MRDQIAAAALDQIFLNARTHNAWLDKPVPDDVLLRLVEICKMAPTSANSQPARFVFVKSAEAKERLAPHLSEGNRVKTMTAPVCAIIGYDLKFYEKLATLFPHEPNARGWFEGDDAKVKEAAFRNGTLQGAYLMIAARALGLDTGPMSGFDNAGVDREFFTSGDVKSNFLCNLGYGDPSALMPRLPRPNFEDMAVIV